MKLQIFVMFVISLTLAACGSQEAASTVSVETFSTPTQPPAETAAIAAPTLEIDGGQAAVQTPTPTPSCTNGLMFLADQTIPDGTLVEPGERLDKRWEVRNNGSCNWDARYRVRLIAGPGMGLPVQQALYPALSGTDFVIRMVFIAPEEPGSYRSACQAHDPLDNPFGHPFFIDVVVPERENPAP